VRRVSDDVRFTVGATPSAQLLARMLYLSYFDWRADDAATPAFEEFVREDPVVARWTSGWGRAGDEAVLASIAGEPAGLAWCRRLRADDSGNSFVSEDIPCLAIAVERSARGHGIGGRLLDLLAERVAASGTAAITLAVEADNPARRLYPRHGFVPELEGNGYVRMRRDLSGPRRGG
jgi:ribosomal protein S18 acetylase RimI-like enzyme